MRASKAALGSLISLVGLLFSASAFAENPVDLFANHGVASPSDQAEAAKVQRAVQRIGDLCDAPEGLREGPSAYEAAQCERAVKEAVQMGSKIASAALSQLDDHRVPHYARAKLLDALARTGEIDTAGALVQALERVADRRANKMSATSTIDEGQITEILERITQYAPVESIPWEPTSEISSDDTAKTVKAWRAWYDSNKTKTRAQLEKDAIEQSRGRVNDSSLKVAFVAARRLAEIKQSRAEGIKALQDLLKRASLTDEQKGDISSEIDLAKERQKQDGARPKRKKRRHHGRGNSLS